MYGLILGILIVASVFLVIFILMQSDKGGGLAGTFGGMGGGGLPFSGREAATLLSKLTTGLAIAFMAICILLSIISRNRAHSASSDSALQKRAQKMQKMQTQSASSVLDQKLPLQGSTPTTPEGEGQVNIPGVTQEAAQTAPAAPAQGSTPTKDAPKPLFGN